MYCCLIYGTKLRTKKLYYLSNFGINYVGATVITIQFAVLLQVSRIPRCPTRVLQGSRCDPSSPPTPDSPPPSGLVLSACERGKSRQHRVRKSFTQIPLWLHLPFCPLAPHEVPPKSIRKTRLLSQALFDEECLGSRVQEGRRYE